MLDGMLILWFILTGLSLVFIIYDLIVVTPEAGIMKVAWVLVALYTGPIGLFFYLISCREHIPGTHEQFIAPLWKQALGSEVHCLAGDATGIIAAAIIISFFQVSVGTEMAIEYFAGFLFGLLIFQALFMKKMMGGTYIKALKSAFMAEWLSMNMIMAGMIPAMMIWRYYDPSAADPTNITFWGSMSLATIIGGILAFPINRWLVKNGLKHGMTTVRKTPSATEHEHMAQDKHTQHGNKKVSNKTVLLMTLLTLCALALGIAISFLYV